MQAINEGAAKIKIGKGVFYNPKMSKLRDVSVLFLRSLKLRNARLLDATAATGIRGIRYEREAGIKNVTMLDMNPHASKSARANVALNKSRARVIGKSLQEFAGSSGEVFDVIDIDPFGSPAPMVHDALKLSKDGTSLMVTATDTATLCGAEGSACLRIYGAKPIHNELCHETSVRILLGFVAREAAQFNFGIEPILSIADMHYIRVFLVLRHGAREAAGSVGMTGFLSHCSRCRSFSYKKGVAASADTKCTNCRADMQIFGPMWLGPLKNDRLVSSMRKLSRSYASETLRFVEKLDDELDMPFFYSIPKITSILKIGSVSLEPVIKTLGKRHVVSRTQFDKDSVKTDADIGDVTAAVRSAAR